MSVIASLGLIVVGLALLLVGAEGVVRGASALAIRFGFSPLIVGLTVVAFGTSSPELFISVDAAMRGAGGFAIGNVVGSNIANLALIAGVAAVIWPITIDRRLLRRDLPLVVAISILLAILLADGVLGRMEGAILTFGIIAYLVFTVRAAHRRRRAQPDPTELARLQEVDLPTRPLWMDSVFVGLGLGLLVFGSQLLTSGGLALATHLGVSQAVVGLTVIAFGTSLPELATTLVAGFRGEGELAIGNAVGSNIFNILGVLGPAALIQPMVAEGVGAVPLGIMVGIAFLAMFLMWTGSRLARWEGALLVGLYVVYVGFMVY
ncbi:calcium/sodium antiporter [soil metagenome]